jgi:hypothetical protein
MSSRAHTVRQRNHAKPLAAVPQQEQDQVRLLNFEPKQLQARIMGHKGLALAE